MIEVVASPMLLDELLRVMSRPKFARYLTVTEVEELVERVRRRATVIDDPANARAATPDPSDDYLVALAEQRGAILVSGDRDLLDATLPQLAVITPRELATRLGL